jgi:hypothetical protein
MTTRTQSGTPVPDSLPALVADTDHELPPTVALTSTLETDMHLIPEQMDRSHIQARQAEAQASRIRRAALAARRVEAAERRARLAREAAVLAARESLAHTAR